MRLYRAAAIVFIVASMLAAAMIVTVINVAAQDAAARTPQWLFEHGHIGEARAVAKRMLTGNPNDATALAWYARTQTLEGDVKGALATAERAVAADRQSVVAHLALAEALGEEAERANVFRQIGLARRVRTALEAAVAINPNSFDALNGMMQFYLRAPGVVGGSTQKAQEIAAKLVTIDPARGYLAHAMMASHRKQPDKVEGFFLKAFESSPKSVHPRIALANFYAGRVAQQADAESHAKALLAMDPALLTPYRVLAVVYARARRWQELDDILAKSDVQHPSNLLPWLSAAQVLRATGADRARAERYIRRYLSQPPEIGMPTHAVAHELLKGWKVGGLEG